MFVPFGVARVFGFSPNPQFSGSSVTESMHQPDGDLRGTESSRPSLESAWACGQHRKPRGKH